MQTKHDNPARNVDEPILKIQDTGRLWVEDNTIKYVIVCFNKVEHRLERIYQVKKINKT